MNDPVLLAKKLGDLALLAKSAATEFEKASVYAATEAIAAAFSDTEDQVGDYALENVEKARWSICAAVGYDITNGHDKSQHVSWAMGAASVVEDVVSKLK